MSTARPPIVIDPGTQAWLDALAAAAADRPPIYELSPQDAREVFRFLQANASVDPPPAKFTTV